MDFFAQQDQARRNTSWLVVLFLIAVSTLILVTNLLVTLTVWSFAAAEGEILHSLINLDNGRLLAQFSGERFAHVSLAVTGVVICAVLYKSLQLTEGGKRIAESLGGQRLLPNSEDPDEIRALNVVEEMAIASGMPVPPVYLLPHELSINAFAAGNSPADAVIGLTRGSIQKLERTQLQGVIAHEFSHILNGDMRLNLRLIALLHGIVFIGMVGEMLLRGSSRSSGTRSNNKRNGQLVLLGLGLMVVGWLGSFFGNMIKASVSRQREFLADASAVQFTRNPQGIADALKVIDGHTQGTEIGNQYASEVSHLFFGQSLKRLSGMFATHPPLVERILRIEPNWDGYPISARRRATQQAPLSEASAAENAKDDNGEKGDKLQRTLEAVILGSVAGGDSLTTQTLESAPSTNRGNDLERIPPRLKEHARDPLGSVALVYALLLSDASEARSQQLAILQSLQIAGLADYCLRLKPQLQALPSNQRLPLIELCLPALKCMSAQQYPTFKKGLMLLIKADEQIELFEWCLYQLVRHYLAPEHEKPRPSKNRYSRPQQVAEEFRLVLSLLAHHGHQDPADAERAFNRGAGCTSLYNLTLLPPDECNIDAFIQAMSKLADCQPILKPRLLKGFERCVKQDGVVNAQERELITSIAAVMDSPLPDLSVLD